MRMAEQKAQQLASDIAAAANDGRGNRPNRRTRPTRLTRPVRHAAATEASPFFATSRTWSTTRSGIGTPVTGTLFRNSMV